MLTDTLLIAGLLLGYPAAALAAVLTATALFFKLRDRRR